jgi:cysteine desulfurase / selenocysteine lyase
MASLPDPAVIARLANEFFAALPGNPAPQATAAAAAPPVAPVAESSVAASGAPLAGTEVLTPQTPNPSTPPVAISSLYFLDAEKVSPWSSPLAFPGAGQFLSFPESPALQPWEAAPGANLSPPSEDDLGALATSPAGTGTAAVAQIPTSAQPPSIPGAAASVGVQQISNAADFTAVPRAIEPFSFSGIPDLSATAAVPSAFPPPPAAGVPNASPVPAEPGATATAPVVETPRLNQPPEFPGVEQFFSLPAVPDLQVGSSVPPPPAAETDLRAVAASLAGTTPLTPHVPAAVPPPDSPATPPYFLEVKKAADFAAQPRLPARSEMFSLPNVPGAQSPPGAPAPSEPDPRVPPASDEQVLTFMTDLSSPSGVASDPGKISFSSVPAGASPSVPRSSSEFHTVAVPALQPSRRIFDPHAVRRDFPVLQERVHGRPLIWLDNAATTQKPQAVIDRLSHFYEHENSNIHRAAHTMAARATDAYESAREKVRRFINAPSGKEIVFVRGATEAINLAAQSWGKRHINAGDEVIISWIEHHSNIVPWQLLCAEKRARLRVAPVDDDGQVILEEYEKLLNPRTRLVSITQVSNALGTILPVKEMIQMAHRHGARVLVDGAQAIAHMRVDVQTLDCDFYAFSGHKIFGPTGIGVLYGKPDALSESPPWQGGGSMIVDVTFEKSVYQTPPARFEAGTGNIADAVGLGAALDYLDELGMETISRYEHDLLLYGMEQLRHVPGLRLIGTAREKASVMSFVLDGYRTEDVGAALDSEGIAVRAGHHCAQPALRRFGLETSVRPSLALYNTYEDVDALADTLRRLQAGREKGPSR